MSNFKSLFYDIDYYYCPTIDLDIHTAEYTEISEDLIDRVKQTVKSIAENEFEYFLDANVSVSDDKRFIMLSITDARASFEHSDAFGCLSASATYFRNVHEFITMLEGDLDGIYIILRKKE